MLKSGHRIVPVTGKEQDKLLEKGKIFGVGSIRLQPGGWLYTSPFILFADKIYDFKFKPSDVVVMTFPKSGTTWMQEIVWTLRNNPNLDHPCASAPIADRAMDIGFDFTLDGTNFPVMDPEQEFKQNFQKLFPGKDANDGVALQSLEVADDPRTIKSHIPFSLFNPKMLEICKVIYVARNPKDVTVSYHHLLRLFSGFGYSGTLDDTVTFLTNDTVLWGPYWQHLKDAWDRRNHPSLHFVYYEDLKENPKREITRIQNFLNLELTDQQINNIVEYTSFSAMKSRDNLYGEITKENKMENTFLNVDHIKMEGGFFRKGIVGDWKNRLTEAQAKKIEEWTKKNTEAFGPDFRYQILK